MISPTQRPLPPVRIERALARHLVSAGMAADGLLVSPERAVAGLTRDAGRGLHLCQCCVDRGLIASVRIAFGAVEGTWIWVFGAVPPEGDHIVDGDRTLALAVASGLARVEIRPQLARIALPVKVDGVPGAGFWSSVERSTMAIAPSATFVLERADADAPWRASLHDGSRGVVEREERSPWAAAASAVATITADALARPVPTREPVVPVEHLRTPDGLKSWRASYRLTRAQAAAITGTTTRVWESWESPREQRGVPDWLPILLRALERAGDVTR